MGCSLHRQRHLLLKISLAFLVLMLVLCHSSIMMLYMPSERKFVSVLENINNTLKLLPRCPQIPPGLVGRIRVKTQVSVDEAELSLLGRGVQAGGRWWPENCDALWRVAVLVPYRDREPQLGVFLHHIHPFLQRQQLNYTIYLVEQAGTGLFNRGTLLNVGYLESLREGPWDCYVFHDVDAIPENDRHLYDCPPQPRHLAVAPDTYGYGLVYAEYIGGASMMTGAQVEAVNGWSNMYEGWGGEDDDMYHRILAQNMTMVRDVTSLATYTMLKHKVEPGNPLRMHLLNDAIRRYVMDGLNSVRYRVLRREHRPLYTHLLVELSPNLLKGLY